MVNAHCIAWCSAPGTVNGNGFCGSTSNYMGSGSTDCSMCTPAPTPVPTPVPTEGCPSTCQYCPTGIASDGGVADVNGLCREWCSIPSSVNGNGHCGNSNLYTTGSDCRGCTLPCPATCHYCPQGIASDGGVADINGMRTQYYCRCIARLRKGMRGLCSTSSPGGIGFAHARLCQGCSCYSASSFDHAIGTGNTAAVTIMCQMCCSGPSFNWHLEHRSDYDNVPDVLFASRFD